MKKLGFISSIIICLTLFFGNIFSQNIYSDSWDGIAYIMFKPSVPVVKSDGKIVEIADVKILSDLADEFGIVRVEKINHFSPDEDMQRILRIYFTHFSAIDLLQKKLLSNNDIKYAERAPIFELFSNVNDGLYLASVDNRWHLDKINAEAAWEVPRQTNSIKIAVVDKAMDTDHPDLVAQWDVLYDIYDDDDDTNPPPSVADNHASWSHGTHTSGLAGATTNNGIGIASIAYDVRLMGIKITNDYEMNVGGVTAPPGSMIAAYEGLTWAADNGADIISMSWGGRYYSLIKQEIVNYAAITKKCLLLAGAGNNGTSDKYYPAALENVIAVAGTNGDDKLNTTGMPPLYVSGGSNFGTWIDVCAPGFGMTNSSDQKTVFSTSYNDSYMTIGGTSMATPIVAGLAALVKSINPQLSANSIKNIIMSTCVDIASLQIDAERRNGVGAGRIDAAAAANLAYNSIHALIPDFTANYIHISEGEAVDFTDLSCGIGVVSWSWSFPGSLTGSSTSQNPSNIVYPTAGTYNVTLEISDGANTETIVKNSYINVRAASSKWIEQASAFNTPYRTVKDIAIVDENIAWATAYDGVNEFLLNEFSRTNNAGQTWVTGLVSGADIPETYRISNIHPISYSKAFACMHNALKPPQGTPYGGIYVSDDGGLSWTHQLTAAFSSDKSLPNFVHFFNQNDGLCVGNPVDGFFEIYTTNNAGASWVRVIQANIPTPQGGELATIGQYEAYSDILWFGTNKGRVFKSINKGQSWTVSSTGLSKINQITFANENIGIVQNISKNILNTHIVTFENKITTNGGSSWSSFTPGQGIRKSSLDFVPGNPNLLISVGTDGTIVETQGSAFSTDLGLTWTNIDEGVHYSTVKMFTDEIGYAGGVNRSAFSGGIFKWNPNDTPTNIEVSIPLSTNDFRFYPNPANDILYFECENVDITASVSFYELTGREVLSIHYSASGFLSEKIDVSALTKGIYVVGIKNGNSVTFEKIVLQ